MQNEWRDNSRHFFIARSAEIAIFADMMKKSLFLFAAVVGFCASVWAQNADSVAFANASWQVEKLPRGARALSARIEMFGSHQTVTVVRYRTGAFYTRLILNRELTSTSATARKTSAVAAINAGYWDMGRTERPSAYVRIDGHDCAHTSAAETFRVNGIVVFGKKKMEVFECDTTRYGLYASQYDNILASGPVLIDDGRAFDYSDRDNSFFGRHPRSAIGRTARGETVLITVDGRREGEADGMTIDELIDLCRWLGLEDAINLDGGGSTTLCAGDRVINYPCGNGRFDHEGERAVSSSIVVLR